MEVGRPKTEDRSLKYTRSDLRYRPVDEEVGSPKTEYSSTQGRHRRSDRLIRGKEKLNLVSEAGL